MADGYVFATPQLDGEFAADPFGLDLETFSLSLVDDRGILQRDFLEGNRFSGLCRQDGGEKDQE